MATLIAYYSRAGENYFGGAYRRIAVGNTEKAAKMLAELTGGELFKIEQKKPYSDDYQTCIVQAKADLQAGAGQIGMAIAPGIIVTPLALDEFNGPRDGQLLLWAAETRSLSIIQSIKCRPLKGFPLGGLFSYAVQPSQSARSFIR